MFFLKDFNKTMLYRKVESLSGLTRDLAPINLDRINPDPEGVGAISPDAVHAKMKWKGNASRFRHFPEPR